MSTKPDTEGCFAAIVLFLIGVPLGFLAGVGWVAHSFMVQP